MSAAAIAILRRADLLAGLDDAELLQISQLCRVVRRMAGDVVFRERQGGDDLFIIYEGRVEVQVTTRGSDGQMRLATINTLTRGQSFGELVLLGSDDRTATVVCVEDSTLLRLYAPDMVAMFDQNPRSGYIVFRNLAQELAYKLRSSNLLLQGTIRWRDGQLGSRS